MPKVTRKADLQKSQETAQARHRPAFLPFPLGHWMQALPMRLLPLSLYLGYASARAWCGQVGMGGGSALLGPGTHMRDRTVSSRGAISALRNHLLEDK